MTLNQKFEYIKDLYESSNYIDGDVKINFSNSGKMEEVVTYDNGTKQVWIVNLKDVSIKSTLKTDENVSSINFKCIEPDCIKLLGTNTHGEQVTRFFNTMSLFPKNDDTAKRMKKELLKCQKIIRTSL